MPKPRARCATSWPMRPKPTMPSVFSCSSTPLNRARSHAPPVSEACACGTLRASASSSAIVCSAAVITFDCGALATTTAAPGRRLDVDVVHADAGPGDDAQPVGLGEQIGVDLRGRTDHDASKSAMRALERRPGPNRYRSRRRGRRRAAARRRSRRSFSATSTLPAARSCGLRHDPVDARGQRLDVGRFDRREHADAQLVAAELAVRLDVDDAVGPQRLGDRGGIDVVGEVDRADDQRALRRIGRRTASRTATPRPSRTGASTTRGCARRRSRDRRRRASTRPGRRAAAASPAPACCRSDPGGSCPARWPGTATPASTGRVAPASSPMRSTAAGLTSASHRPPSEPNDFCGAK